MASPSHEEAWRFNHPVGNLGLGSVDLRVPVFFLELYPDLFSLPGEFLLVSWVGFWQVFFGLIFVDWCEVDLRHFGLRMFRGQEFEKVGEEVGLEDRVLDVGSCPLPSPGIGEFFSVGAKAYGFSVDENGEVSG